MFSINLIIKQLFHGCFGGIVKTTALGTMDSGILMF